MTFTALKDASAEHYFDLIDQLRAIKALLKSENPPMRVIDANLEGMEADLNEWFGKLDAAAMQEG